MAPGELAKAEPAVRPVRWRLAAVRRVPVVPLGIITIMVLTAVFAQVLTPYSAVDIALPERLRLPCWEQGGSLAHPLGTDPMGRDLLARMIYGARISLVFLPWNFSCATGSEGMILPSKYFQQVGADGFARAPIGSGPYRVVKNAVGSLIQLEAVDRHWHEGVPQFNTVTFRLVPEEGTRLAQLRAGEADIIAVSREKVPEVKSAGFNVFAKLNDQVVVVYMQQQWDPVPVAEKRVRQALNLALDKEAILKFVFASQGAGGHVSHWLLWGGGRGGWLPAALSI
jgi:Bacterial extracellular solute-binding proteins, family 5 Middle